MKAAAKPQRDDSQESFATAYSTLDNRRNRSSADSLETFTPPPPPPPPPPRRPPPPPPPRDVSAATTLHAAPTEVSSVPSVGVRSGTTSPTEDDSQHQAASSPTRHKQRKESHSDRPRIPPSPPADPNDLNDVIPVSFVEGCQGDMIEARRRWQVTKKWRAENRVDYVLEEPQPNFAMIKKLYPHAVHKMGKSGHWVYIERPGHAHLETLWKSGLSFADFERHYTFITEYLWRVIDPRPNGQIISIFDVENSSISELAGKTLKMFKKCSALVGAHYPERSFKIFIVNAPWYFSTGWSILSPFLDPRTRQKISIVRSNAQKALAPYCDAHCLPREIGGTDTVRFGESDAEKGMWELVKRLNDAHGFPTRPDFCVPHLVKGGDEDG